MGADAQRPFWLGGRLGVSHWRPVVHALHRGSDPLPFLAG